MRNTLITTAATAALLLPAGPALAAQPSGSWCAAGWQTWDVSNEPYQQDNAADENGNGIVCARALGKGQSKQLDTAMTIYIFADDEFPA